MVISQRTNILLHNWPLWGNAGPAWNTPRPCFTPFFHEFFSNAPYKFTQLTNLRHLIFALGLFGWRIPFIEVFFWWEYFFFILAFSYTPIFLGTHVGSRTRPWYTVVEHCWDQKIIPGGSDSVTMPLQFIRDSNFIYSWLIVKNDETEMHSTANRRVPNVHRK